MIGGSPSSGRKVNWRLLSINCRLPYRRSFAAWSRFALEQDITLQSVMAAGATAAANLLHPMMMAVNRIHILCAHIFRHPACLQFKRPPTSLHSSLHFQWESIAIVGVRTASTVVVLPFSRIMAGSSMTSVPRCISRSKVKCVAGAATFLASGSPHLPLKCCTPI